MKDHNSDTLAEIRAQLLKLPESSRSEGYKEFLEDLEQEIKDAIFEEMNAI